MIEKDINRKLSDARVILRESMELCFKHLQQNPEDTKKILSVWKDHGTKIYGEFMTMSDKYDNNTVGKEITKMIMFRGGM